MAVIEKDYLTFAELRDRWGVTDEEMHYLISQGHLVPSIARVDPFFICYWEPDADSGEALSLKKSAEGSDLEHIQGWVYLQNPRVTGPSTYTFRIATKVLTPNVENFVTGAWYMLATTSSANAYVIRDFVDQAAVSELCVFMRASYLNCEIFHPALDPDLRKKSESDKQDKSALVERKAFKWPWGNHETELLRKLEEAVRKWWVNYDPTDATTAPTNKQVSSWLEDQGVANRTAEVMATIIRDERLPSGPRK